MIVEMQIDPLLLSNPTKHLIGKSAKFRPGNPGEIRNFNRKSTEAVRYPAKNLDINFANDSHTFPTTVKTILADHGNHKSLSVLTLTKERIFLGGVARFNLLTYLLKLIITDIFVRNALPSKLFWISTRLGTP